MAKINFLSRVLSLRAALQYVPSKKKVRLSVSQCERGHVFQLGPETFSVTTDFLGDMPLPNFDFALFGAAAISMRQNFNIESDLPVTQSTVDAIRRATDVLRTWHAANALPIELFCENIVEPPLSTDEKTKLILFSGGIDSTFSALREVEEGEVSHALFFSGMSRNQRKSLPYYDVLEAQVRQNADSIGLKLITASLSYRPHALDVEIGLGHELTMMLVRHGNWFKEGILASDFNPIEEYACSPWGNSIPIISALGSGAYPVRQATSHHGRTEKLQYIGERAPELLANLAVCHKFMAIGRNCGTCPKCVRTALNFVGAEVGPPVGLLFGVDLAEALEAMPLPAKQAARRRELVFLLDVYRALPRSQMREACEKRLQALERKTMRTGRF